MYNPGGIEKPNWNILFNTVICSPEIEPKVVKNLQAILSNANPIQIWFSRNYKIQTHKNTKMRQYLNYDPSPCSSLVFVRACEGQEGICVSAG